MWAQGFCKQRALKVPPSRQVTETRGYWKSHHPIPQICWGKSADSRYKGLQWRCCAAGHTDHNLWWKGAGYGGVKDYWQGNGNNHKGGTSQGDCNLEAGPLQCSHVRVTPAVPQMCKMGQEAQERGTSTTTSEPIVLRGFCLDNVQGLVCTTGRVTIPLLGTINIHGQKDVWGHCMQVHVLAEPSKDCQLPTSIVLATTYR